MKTKLFLMSATLLAALSLTGVASADTTRDQIEAEGNQQIQAYWNEYQQALQDRQNAWEQSHGDIYTPAWQDANAHAGAAYREWLEARTALGDRLHAYDVAQWEKESDQPSNQTPVDDSQVPEENSQALNTQGSQATVPTSQSATPASQVKLSSQSTAQKPQQASVADPASQPITQSSQISAEQPQTEVTKTDQPQTKTSTVQPSQQASVEAKSATHGPQQTTTSQASDKTANLPVQSKKPLQSSTEQDSKQAELPQTGNANPLAAAGALLLAFWTALIGVWKRL